MSRAEIFAALWRIFQHLLDVVGILTAAILVIGATWLVDDFETRVMAMLNAILLTVLATRGRE